MRDIRAFLPQVLTNSNWSVVPQSLFVAFIYSLKSALLGSDRTSRNFQRSSGSGIRLEGKLSSLLIENMRQTAAAKATLVMNFEAWPSNRRFGIASRPAASSDIAPGTAYDSFPIIHKFAYDPAAAKLPSNHHRSFCCRPNLVGVAPFVSPLLSSARHIRAPAVEESPRNSRAAAGNLYLGH